MKFPLRCAVVLLVWSYGLMCHAGALCPERPIRFAHYEFGLLYSEGHGGIDDDIQRELARRSGCTFEVTLKPRARIWRELEDGSLDMAGSGVQTPARDAFARFAHYVFEDNRVVVGPRVPAEIKRMEDLVEKTQLTFGGVRSYSYSPYYDVHVERLIEQKRFYEVADPQILHRMFDAGRFDIFIASQFLTLHYFKVLKLPVPVRMEDWDPAGPTPSGLVISRRTFSEAQGRGWQALIQQMLDDGTVRKIVRKHMGKHYSDEALFALPKPERAKRP